MSENPATAASQSPAGVPSPAPRPRRRVPPWFVAAPVACLLLAVVLLRTVLIDIDPAIRNIASFVMSFVAVLVLLAWFVLRSGFARGLRLGVLTAAILAVVVPAVVLKVESFNGSMVPTLRWRWTTPADRLLPAAQAAQSEPPADLTATTDHDFPQFLGPNRDGAVPGVELAKNWATTPPELVWRQPIGAGWSAFAVVGPYAVTMEQRGPDELVTCYHAASGELAWVQSTATRHESTLGGVGPRSTPTIVDGKVYALGATGRLRCLDGATGTVVWQKDMLAEFGVAPPEADMDAIAWGRAGSPLVVGDLVVVPAGGPNGSAVSLVAYDRHTGSETWRAGETQISYASPSLFNLLGVPTIVSVNESNVTGHDPHTGAVLWQEAWPGSSTTAANNSQAVALDDHRIFLSKGYGGGCKLFEVQVEGNSGGAAEPRTWKTDTLWAVPANMQTKFTNVVRRDGAIFGLSENVLECIDQETGKRHWKRGRYGHGQVLLVGDALLVLGETGELALVAADPGQYEELGKLQALEGKTWNNLAFSSPYLLVRNGQEAACFRLPLAGQAADKAAPSEDSAPDASPPENR
ncbi:MAG TPA: PQQ-binding-like beta-propeller repeat protein [Pirellulales bacterium]|nr:PQQ-binding-like beta-propeller repeat protein [Pirellulales bacterium]